MTDRVMAWVGAAAALVTPGSISLEGQARGTDDGYILYENACHEGNESLVGILSGARATERANRKSQQQ